jgi:hypothetical protein
MKSNIECSFDGGMHRPGKGPISGRQVDANSVPPRAENVPLRPYVFEMGRGSTL